MRFFKFLSIVLILIHEAFGQLPEKDQKILEEERKIIQAEISEKKNSPAKRIDYLTIREMNVETACRLLSYSTGHNIIPTSDSGKEVASFLFRNGSVEEALNALCVSSGLVYRKNPSHEGYQILTISEFRENNIYSAEEKIEIFEVNPVNVELIAEILQALYPQEIIYSEAPQLLDLSSSNSGGGLGGNSQGMGNFSGGTNSRQVGGQFGSGFGNQSGMGMGMGMGGQQQLDRTRMTQLEALEAQSDLQNTTEGDSETSEEGGKSIYVTVNLENHQIVVRTSNIAALTTIGKLIKEIDKPIKQVVLEMKILELDIGNARTTSVDFGSNQSENTEEINSLNLGNFASEPAATFVFNYLKSDFDTRVQAIASNNDVEILATPMIIAANGRQSQIEVGEERVIVTGASTDTSIAGETGTRNDLVTLQTDTRTIGTTLSVIPRINNDGTVALHVEQELSTLIVGNNSIPVNGQNIPIDSVDSASISSDVIVESGKTIAIGGLIRTENSNQISKVPILGDLPLIKHAFRRKSDSAKKGELILLITPYIVEGGSTGEKFDEKLKDRSAHRYFEGGEKSMDELNPSLEQYKKNKNTKNKFPFNFFRREPK